MQSLTPVKNEKLHVVVIDKKEWKEKYSENAHLIAFSEAKPKEFDRIDYALLVVWKNTDKIGGYITCREHDHETVYWQFGGTMPETKGTTGSLRCYDAALEFAGLNYKRILTVIENTNYPMLKMALYRGFKIVGMRYYNDAVLLELVKEF